MIACYLGLYEEGEVEHINGPTLPCPITLMHLARYQKAKGGNFYMDASRMRSSTRASYPNILTTT